MEDIKSIEASLLAAFGATTSLLPDPIPAPVEALADFHGLPTSSAPFSIAEALSFADLPSHDHAPTPPEVKPSEIPPSPVAKRPLDSNAADGEPPAKRQNTGNNEPAGIKHEVDDGAAGLDLGAALMNALANVPLEKDQGNIASHEVAGVPTFVAEPLDARSPTVSPGPDKIEDRIMKASSNSIYVIRFMSFPLLGNLAVQILLRLSQQNRLETELLLADHESHFSKDYERLVNMFFTARKVFSDSPLFFPDDLGITDLDDRETIRMANLASTAASVFGANDVAMLDVHKSFLNIFLPEDGGYRASLTDLLVGLKTQVFMDSLRDVEEAEHVAALVDEFFPVDSNDLLGQRTGDAQLKLAERLPTTRIREKRNALLGVVNDPHIKGWLSSQYSAGHFADDLSVFLRGHLNMVVDYADKYGVNIPISRTDLDATQVHSEPETSELASILQSATSQFARDGETQALNHTAPHEFMADASNPPSGELDIAKALGQALSPSGLQVKREAMPAHPPDPGDSMDLASLIQEQLGCPPRPHNSQPGYPATQATLAPSTRDTPSQSFPHYATPEARAQTAGPTANIKPQLQSDSTQALYDRARRAMAAKHSNTSRREGAHSTRRPWTQDEEQALMMGLDMVKGPHWSQILGLFGPNGSVNHVLKDRNQVQLKDKARNLKLFFLKSGCEIPFYLQQVTGELKTRAPGQAARREAEEKERLGLEEHRATVEGIMTLSGLQNGQLDGGHAVGSPAQASSMTLGASPSASAPPVVSMASAPPVPIPPLIKAEVPGHQAHQPGRLAAIQPAQTLATPMSAPAPTAQTQPTLKPQPPPQTSPYQTANYGTRQPPLPASPYPVPNGTPQAPPQTASYQTPTQGSPQLQPPIPATAPRPSPTQAQAQPQGQSAEATNHHDNGLSSGADQAAAAEQSAEATLFQTLQAALADGQSQVAPVAPVAPARSD
ncbi:telomere repeat binding factor-domain-containing protein [Echria macrotheca]|uniref:Telomere repeat binding factor-domain-containing protein n=1 Tax=Echria macrotheca TaxID=438768 RepID=A0AAJ0BS97_9PEZI|nr:telomere repeat binding factor-domain-containing protein [Echria macrotheca]